jgi:cell wall-associated NlpC family hydrolase
MDCRGVVEYWQQEVGTPIPGLEDIDPENLSGHAAWECFEAVEPPLRSGDVIVWSEGAAADHLGVYHDGRVLHAIENIGRIVSSPVRMTVLKGARFLRRRSC